MSQPTQSSDTKNETCPRRTPWCARHDHELNFCWSVDVHHAHMVLNLCNGTISGEPKIFGLDEPRESFTLPEAKSLQAALGRLQALAALPQLPDPAPAGDQHHTPWCVDHDGDVCFGELFNVAGLQLQLAHSDGHTHVVGLDDAHMPDVLPMGDVAVLTAVLERLTATASTSTTPATCARFDWCSLAEDPDHATECASLVHHTRDLTGEQWAMYLRCSAGTDLVELAIDGRAHRVPMSGRVPVTLLDGLLAAAVEEREGLLGVLAAGETVAGHRTLVGLAAVGTAHLKDVA